MTWRDDLDQERAQLEREKEQLRQREQDLKRRERGYESTVTAASKTRDRIVRILEGLMATPVIPADATITTKSTDKPEEKFQARLLFRSHELVFVVEATEDGVEVRASHHGESIGRVALEDFTEEFVQERVTEFLDRV